MHFQGTDALYLFGIISAILSVISFVPYIHDILKGNTHPQRAAWFIWTVLGFVALSSQVSEGADASLWFVGIQVAGTALVFILSIAHGRGAFCSARDAVVLFIAAIGLLLWMMTGNAAYALAITISISLLGGAITAIKTYCAPNSETVSKWAMNCVASWFAILAVGELDWILLAYPIYLLALNGAIVLAVVTGRAAQQKPPMETSKRPAITREAL